MLWIAIVLGLVEGFTEFLPVSSTGHLVIAGRLLGFEGPRAAAFEVIIQSGAIGAVIWDRRSYLRQKIGVGIRDASVRRLVLNLTLGFLPAAVVGLLSHDFIEAKLFAPVPVAVALMVGGVAILLCERLLSTPRTMLVDDVRPGQALAVGIAQVLSLWPGTSRAAATILGGMAAGMSRPAATEFSFLLAIPVLAAATGLDLVKRWDLLVGSDLPYLALSFAVAFGSALLIVRGLLRYVRTHTLIPFAIYRVVVAAVILAVM